MYSINILIVFRNNLFSVYTSTSKKDDECFPLSLGSNMTIDSNHLVNWISFRRAMLVISLWILHMSSENVLSFSSPSGASSV